MTPEHPAKHDVVYVTPSSPHAGLHANAAVPSGFFSRPQLSTHPETQDGSGARSRWHFPGVTSRGVSACEDDAHRIQHAFAYVMLPPTHTGSQVSAWQATLHAKRSCSSERGSGAFGAFEREPPGESGASAASASRLASAMATRTAMRRARAKLDERRRTMLMRACFVATRAVL